MKVQCKNCLPKDGIEIPHFTVSEKKAYTLLKGQSSIYAIKKLITEKRVSLKDAKYIVTHINLIYGQCNRCHYDALDIEYGTCPKCKALNFNWNLKGDFD